MDLAFCIENISAYSKVTFFSPEVDVLRVVDIVLCVTVGYKIAFVELLKRILANSDPDPTKTKPVKSIVKQ